MNLQHTENYQLPQWAEDDRIMMGDFNRAMADIDRGIAAAAKASADGLAAVRSDLGSGGKNARIAWGTYKGNGKCGAGNPNTLTFDFTPVWVFISSNNSEYIGNSTLVRPIVNAASQVGGSMRVTWSDRSVSWFTTETVNSNIQQNNTLNHTYYYLAIGY